MDEWAHDSSLIQGSTSWHSARAARLGGSEIASVLRVSPYKTRLELWEEKTGIRPPVSIGHLPHVRRGVDAEPVARAKIEEILGVKYTTPVLVDKELPWMAASLDGLCPDHTLEIKTMSESKHRDVAWGWIPDYYECQVQWGLMISGRSRGLFASYRPEDETLYWHWIKRDDAFIHEMYERAVEFWTWVVKRIPPPDPFAGRLF